MSTDRMPLFREENNRKNIYLLVFRLCASVNVGRVSRSAYFARKSAPPCSQQEGIIVYRKEWTRILSFRTRHRLNMELDLQSLFGLHVHSYTHWMRIHSPPPHPPRIWAHIRGRYWSPKTDDISLWPPCKRVLAPASWQNSLSPENVHDCCKATAAPSWALGFSVKFVYIYESRTPVSSMSPLLGLGHRESTPLRGLETHERKLLLREITPKYHIWFSVSICKWKGGGGDAGIQWVWQWS